MLVGGDPPPAEVEPFGHPFSTDATPRSPGQWLRDSAATRSDTVISATSSSRRRIPSRYSLMARSGFLSAALEHGDVLCVEASGLFIAGRDHQQ